MDDEVTWFPVSNGYGGFAAELTPMLQGRVYRIAPRLWRWEIKELTYRDFISTGTAMTAEDAQKEAEKVAVIIPPLQ